MNKNREWYAVSGFPGYFMNTKNEVGNKNKATGEIEPLIKVDEGRYVYLLRGKDVLKAPVFYLRTKTRLRKIDSYQRLKYFTRVSGEGRNVLNRIRVINLLIRYMPHVHISLTKNRIGKFETTDEMKQIGMIVCEDCGHIQNVEERNCKSCGEYLIK